MSRIHEELMEKLCRENQGPGAGAYIGAGVGGLGGGIAGGVAGSAAGALSTKRGRDIARQSVNASKPIHSQQSIARNEPKLLSRIQNPTAARDVKAMRNIKWGGRIGAAAGALGAGALGYKLLSRKGD